MSGAAAAVGGRRRAEVRRFAGQRGAGGAVGSERLADATRAGKGVGGVILTQDKRELIGSNALVGHLGMVVREQPVSCRNRQLEANRLFAKSGSDYPRCVALSGTGTMRCHAGKRA
jgi:hypothetical protein